MLKSHEILHSVSGKRQVLVVDDEAINRELLGMMLADQFDVIFAENGEQALGLIRDNSRTLSLILLDIMMPVMDGFTLLSILKEDPDLKRIPVIVLTSEKSAEVRSLRSGASDFITKPYDLPEVILARVNRTIELSEDTYIIQNTEHDELTGLYNVSYFYRYAEQFEQMHTSIPMDAVVIDVNHFHLINELYGRSYGDQILRKIADNIREVLRIGGIACRDNGDMYLLFIPHMENPEAVYEQLTGSLNSEKTSGMHIRLRLGIYPLVDQTMQMENRFDRAKIACDTIRSNFSSCIAFYDNDLHDKEVFAEQLLEDMEEGLESGQFVVYYQPKYAIQGEKPTLESAEALVRWIHPKYGMISPGLFIPLFEENGLIQKLDRFVWTQAARQIRAWRDTYGRIIPISVNVSRIDMYDPDLAAIFKGLVAENGLSPANLLLEITESAYTEDSDQMIHVVQGLRSEGFRVEMDDFGSGYSSLNMLASLPIDILKLDMAFIRNMLKGERNVRMLELMMDIARFLSVPVIAEGVEEEAQVTILKKLGCQMIQGYYFSKPVPPEEFKKFIEKEL